MTDPLHRVGVGLRTARVSMVIGMIALVVALVAEAGRVAAFHLHADATVQRGLDTVGPVALVGGLGLAALGYLAGFVGRCFCAADTPEAPDSRHARAGVMCEASSIVLAPATIAMPVMLSGFSSVERFGVAACGCGLSLLLLLIGRLLFLGFCRRLAQRLNDPDAERTAGLAVVGLWTVALTTTTALGLLLPVLLWLADTGIAFGVTLLSAVALRTAAVVAVEGPMLRRLATGCRAAHPLEQP